MQSLKYGMVLVVAGLLMPAAMATHGDVAVYATTDGSLVNAVGTYMSGGGNAQTWLFSIYSDTCTAFGSIEVGFQTGTRAGDVCDSGANLVTSGTGHFHAYPNANTPDIHDVSVTYAGFTSPAVVIVN